MTDQNSPEAVVEKMPQRSRRSVGNDIRGILSQWCVSMAVSLAPDDPAGNGLLLALRHWPAYTASLSVRRNSAP